MLERAFRVLGALWLRLFGWRIEGALPPGLRRAVVVAAPHTSNWDLPFMLAVAYAVGVRPSWLGKRELFHPAFGWFMRALGGIPVDRGVRSNLVQQAADRIRTAEKLFLVVPPSGTRSRAAHWKSGFYHIARTADVPVLCSFLDYKRKIGGLGPAIQLSGNVRRDMDAVRAFYGGVTGKFPELETPIRLIEETPDAA